MSEYNEAARGVELLRGLRSLGSSKSSSTSMSSCGNRGIANRDTKKGVSQ